MRKTLLTLVFLWAAMQLWATHNRAGEITFKHISGYTYEITILTYTYSPSPADRPSLEVVWGDGSTSIVNRFQKTFIGNLTNRNLYRGTHTYSGPGNFIISVEDPNRNGGVTNIDGSINVAFYIETELIINPFIGVNNSVQLLNPPIDNGCVGFPFLHNPGAYDVDGDSLSYALVPCKGAGGGIIPTFSWPTASNSLSIDPITGTFIWNSPMLQGEYNIAIMIYEWRFGVLIGSVRRDMQITIAACNNNPPQINVINDTCVEVGSTFSSVVNAVDIDNDIVKLTGSGGPLLLSTSPAMFNQPVSGVGQVSSTFSWTPVCDHVQKQPYQMVFKAQDDGSPVNMVDIETMRIRVVSPGPDNLTAQASGNNINLSWNQHFCSNVKRYDIYRHNGYLGYIPSTCETGVPPWTGYVKIGSTNSIDDTTYSDNNNGYGLIHGNNYCYMVVALFPDSAESYPSLEACASLSKDVPVMINATVDSTSNINGEITIRWTKPTEFDSISIPGPYKYLIYQNEGDGNVNFNLIDSLNGLQDTTYTFKGLNTEDIVHNFKVDFLNNTPGNRYIVGGTQITSSIYLNISPLDKRVLLEWDELVPWINTDYVIYRQNASGIFDSLGTTQDQFYVDSNLVNGTSYCYKIKSIGSYSSNQYPSPLLNFSQITCAAPQDNEAPCPPTLNVVADCQLLENTITWNDVTLSCGKDAQYYMLYYTSTLNGDYSLIYQSSGPQDTVFIHQNLSSIAGCYVITALDTNGNVSDYSAEFCVDIDDCEPYRLPNVFTPNQDGINDTYHPFPYDLVNKIEITIFNRWGVPVFESNDPDINWDGKDMRSKKDCSEGVYFYVCQVYEQRLEGEVKREIRGTITLFRNQ
jgi:gliding motility-associated-like protein